MIRGAYMLDKAAIRKNYPLIRTDRLILRQITSEDKTNLYNCISDPSVYPHLGLHSFPALFPSRLYRYFEESNRTLSTLHFAVCLHEDTSLIGLVSLQKWDDKKGTAILGYCISPAYWNKGIATEAVRAIIELGIQELGLKLIQGRCEESNRASRKVMMNCGMSREEEPQGGMNLHGNPRLITFTLKV
ncbi:GNAT family N-acetyltransferase [Paenibacillus sp. YPG26]|uniref:GNAT family N-acetyltransferase n=1 Tax=Paenibacillus sp. YPG26 TaxID=2878915 RepID=UPI00203DCA72|nr:GNAT family N-acetyltransferase [Paenibacillus sp. YPG26]USB32513.1 GNAT family N-acetyltransferase [Paenibacillus sp. YPG26]